MSLKTITITWKAFCHADTPQRKAVSSTVQFESNHSDSYLCELAFHDTNTYSGSLWDALQPLPEGRTHTSLSVGDEVTIDGTTYRCADIGWEVVSLPKETDRTPFVGNGATVNWWSDSKAGTIVHVSPSGKRIVVQLDKSTRTDKNGMSDCQSYDYERDPNGATYEFSLRKNGRWVVIGHETRDGVSCTIGGRYTYHDFSF